ncbi:hypothetical protein HKD37_04G011640 [Glycine soja]
MLPKVCNNFVRQYYAKSKPIIAAHPKIPDMRTASDFMFPCVACKKDMRYHQIPSKLFSYKIPALFALYLEPLSKRTL